MWVTNLVCYNEIGKRALTLIICSSFYLYVVDMQGFFKGVQEGHFAPPEKGFAPLKFYLPPLPEL